MTDERATPHTWVTYAVIAANLAMFGVELATGVHPLDPTSQQVLDVGASFPPLTLGGEPWRLATSMFLHFGLLHIALNMVCLWQGRVVELLYGRAAFGVLYLVSGLAGGVATAVVSDAAVAAGASGAVFGVYGAFGAFLVLRRDAMPEAVWKTTAKGIGFFVLINLAFGLAMPGISMAAHVGGLVIGFLVGLGLLAKVDGRPSLARTVGVAVASGAVIAGAVFAFPTPVDQPNALQAFATTEEAILEKLSGLDRKLKSGELTEAKAAEFVEREIMLPWRASCDAAIRSRTPSGRELFDAIDKYCDARIASWESFVAALRATSDEDAERLITRYKFLELEVRKAGAAVVAELKKLER